MRAIFTYDIERKYLRLQFCTVMNFLRKNDTVRSSCAILVYKKVVSEVPVSPHRNNIKSFSFFQISEAIEYTVITELIN